MNVRVIIIIIIFLFFFFFFLSFFLFLGKKSLKEFQRPILSVDEMKELKELNIGDNIALLLLVSFTYFLPHNSHHIIYFRQDVPFYLSFLIWS